MEKILTVGEILWTWCSAHMDRTDHLWDGHRLTCLECFPEKDPRKLAEQEPVEVDPD